MRASSQRAVRGLMARAQLQSFIRSADDNSSRITPSACRHVWNDAQKADSALQDRFYDSTVEKVDDSPFPRPEHDHLDCELFKVCVLACCSMPSRKWKPCPCSKCSSSGVLHSLILRKCLQALDMYRKR